MTNNLVYILISFLAIWMYIFRNIYSSSLPIFEFGCLKTMFWIRLFCCCWVVGALYMFWKLIPHEVNVFSPLTGVHKMQVCLLHYFTLLPAGYRWLEDSGEWWNLEMEGVGTTWNKAVHWLGRPYILLLYNWQTSFVLIYWNFGSFLPQTSVTQPNMVLCLDVQSFWFCDLVVQDFHLSPRSDLHQCLLNTVSGPPWLDLLFSIITNSIIILLSRLTYSSEIPLFLFL